MISPLKTRANCDFGGLGQPSKILPFSLIGSKGTPFSLASRGRDVPANAGKRVAVAAGVPFVSAFLSFPFAFFVSDALLEGSRGGDACSQLHLAQRVASHIAVGCRLAAVAGGRLDIR